MAAYGGFLRGIGKADREEDEVLRSIAEHAGVIVGLCGRYWLSIPNASKNYYDVDDFIADAVLHLIKRLDRFDASKAQKASFIWTVTENFCLDSVRNFRTTKRTPPIYRDEGSSSKARFYAPASRTIDTGQMQLEGLEAVITNASPELRRNISAFLSRPRVKWPSVLLSELSELCERFSIRYEELARSFKILSQR